MRGLVISLFALVLVVAAPLKAGQADPRLDALFYSLATADDRATAKRAETLIWILWFETESVAAGASVEAAMDAASRGDYDAALALLGGAVEVAPEFAEAWNRRATIHFVTGDFARSIADIQRVLALEPRHFGALSGLGLIYDEMGEDAAALRAYRAALKINPHLDTAKRRVAVLTEAVEGQPL